MNNLTHSTFDSWFDSHFFLGLLDGWNVAVSGVRQKDPFTLYSHDYGNLVTYISLARGRRYHRGARAVHDRHAAAARARARYGIPTYAKKDKVRHCVDFATRNA